MRINQVWIIMNNGICPIHLLYSGQILEENLFAAFVRALFSFSKDMSEGEKSISSMTLGDMDIHYLAEEEEKFFVAISAEVGIPQSDIDLYLNYISNLFALYYPDYIEKLPAFEPPTFEYFKQSIDFFIRYTETKKENEDKGLKDLSLEFELKSLKYSLNNIVLRNYKDNILRIVNKKTLSVAGTYYSENGSIKSYDIQHYEKFVTILSDDNVLTIIPFIGSPISSTAKTLRLDFDATWLTSHPVDNLIYLGNQDEVYEYNIDSDSMNKIEISVPIVDVIIHKSNSILVISSEHRLYTLQLPLVSENQVKNSIISDQVHSLIRGPSDLIMVVCRNQSLYLWFSEEKQLLLKERYPTSSHITFSENYNILFLITEYNEFLIYDSNDASLLVNYNLVNPALGAFVTENNKLVVIYKNGELKWFSGFIDRAEIAQLRNFLTKRVEHVENNIIRIHSGFQKIITNLDNKYRSSSALKNDLNQVKVFRQQLKRLIDDKLLERTSILRDLYFRLLGYQNQVNSLIKLIKDLESKVESSFKKSKENELSGKTPKERIEDYLNSMKPRDQIGLGSLAENLQLPYEECLTHLKTLESRGLLPGFLTRGSSISIKDNVIFVKKDPKFEETGITSF